MLNDVKSVFHCMTSLLYIIYIMCSLDAKFDVQPARLYSEAAAAANPFVGANIRSQDQKCDL